MKLFKKDSKKLSEHELLEKKVDEMMSVEINPEEDEQLEETPSEFKELNNKLKDLNVEDDTLKVKTLKIDDDLSEKPDETDLDKEPVKDDNQKIIDKDNLDNESVNKAVDDIVSKESDQALETPKLLASNKKPKKKFLKRLFKSKIFYLIVLILLIVFSIPYTRYKILGYILKKEVSISITDSITKDQVSDVLISINGQNHYTNSSGEASFNLGVGPYQVKISKAYYKTYYQRIFVGFTSNPVDNISLMPTGRQLSIKLLNVITSQPIENGTISYSGTSSQTNSFGVANIVIPNKNPTDNILVSANGYNQTNLIVKTDNKILNETLSLVPSGTVYYLKQINGVMDVVGSNLDGSNQKIILSGTGNENAQGSFLYPSPNWNKLILITNRSGPNQGVYVVDPSNGQSSEIDSSLNTINPVGWYNDQFIYQNNGPYNLEYNPGNNQLKSYSLDTNQLNIIDQSQIQGTQSNYVYQSFQNPVIVGNQLLYITDWLQSGSYVGTMPDNTIRVTSLDQFSKKDIFSISNSTGYISQIIQPYPNSAYVLTFDNASNNNSVYQYLNGSLSEDNSPNAYTNFQNLSNQTAVLNPSATKTAWSEIQNGSPTLFIGDQNGYNQTQLSNLTGYSFVAWYNDQYILVSKKNNLYVAAITGSNNTPLLVGSYLSLN